MCKILVCHQFNIVVACSSAIIPAGSTLSKNSTAVLDFPSISHDSITTLMVADLEANVKDAIFIVSETNQSVSSSFCNISGLEVFRGREQAIEISYEGFILNDKGQITVRYSH